MFVFSVSTFVALAGHQQSQDSIEQEGFSLNLNSSFRNQPALQALRKRSCFISLAFTHQPSKIEFIDVQKEMIIAWINGCVKNSSE